jgi:hypothetical protein
MKRILAVMGFCLLSMGFCNAAEVPSSYTSLHFQGVGAFYNYMPDQETVRFPLYLEQQFNLFRIYVPPGVRQVFVELYVPRDALLATVAHFGTPPESTTSTKHYDYISPLITPTLDELKDHEVFCANIGGHITVVSASTTNFQTSDIKNRWLYVKLLRYGVGSVGLTQIAVDLNVAELKAWYASMTDADWAYLEDVDTPSKNQKPGDVNGDDHIDLTDAMLVLKILAGLSGGNISIYADVNGDKKIGIEELEYILQVVAGLKP